MVKKLVILQIRSKHGKFNVFFANFKKKIFEKYINEYKNKKYIYI